MQSDLLNEVGHPSTTVLPLTTQLIESAAPLRYRIAARDQLQADSDIMLDQTRTIDNHRFTGELLALLTDLEMLEVESYWSIVKRGQYPFFTLLDTENAKALKKGTDPF